MIPPILTTIASLGYKVYTKGDWNLNLFAIRSVVRDANSFDDLIGCAYKEGGLWKVEWWECTTDPGTPFLTQPINSAGAAVLAPGQNVGAFRIANHRGQYPALCQTGPVTVYRDDNRDNVIDMTPGTTQTGYFGINIHKRAGTDDSVDGASAGCQVFRYEAAFDRMMWLARKQTSERGWKTYTYTLMNEGEM
jgi:hypothetical protein